jgi:DNA-binding beta-propeller fold protein YncE
VKARQSRFPEGSAVNPATGDVYVADAGSNTVSVISG